MRDYDNYGFNYDLSNNFVYLAHTTVHAALQILVYFGVVKIYIAGMDLCNTDKTHFFGEIPEKRNQDRESWFQSCFELMENITPRLGSRGVELVNLSPLSRLKEIMTTEAT